MANILFNELSSNISTDGLASVLRTLAEDLKFLNNLKVGRPIFYAGEYSRLVGLFYDKDKNFLNIVNQLDKDSKLLIHHFLGSTHSLDSTDHHHTEQTTKSTIDYLNSFIDLPSKIGSISFRSKTAWNVWQLNFANATSPHHVFSFSHVTDLAPDLFNRSAELEKFISSLPVEVIGNIKGIDCLPRLSISSFYFSQLKDLYEIAQKIDRIGSHVIVGSGIARLNGYVARPEIEKLNKNGDKIRHIFYSEEANRYLSIDIMHGAFEVCSSDGTHLKEINFSGDKLSKANSSHGIRIS